MPAFTRAFVSHAAPQVGVREGRRVVGRYQSSRARMSCHGSHSSTTRVARGSWPIELWQEGHLGATYEYLEDGQTYDIPAPLSAGRARSKNLFMAGRCLSASREALGSARVIGTCLATGDGSRRHRRPRG